jgi:dTMP kinase
MAKAAFISLDGLDGTGKSTQCRLLADWLCARGHSVAQCADPGGTAIGNVIRSLLLDHRREMTLPCEAFLFMASRAQLTAELIRPALAEGRIVISDRYLLANVVYQGHAGGLDPKTMWEIGRLATGGLEPDLTFVLDLPVEVAISRRSRPADRMESRGSAFDARVREGFLAEASRRPGSIRVIDANQPVDVVHGEICRAVGQLLATEHRS